MDLSKIKTDNFPEEIFVFVEIPEGSLVKYELDKDMGIIVADRFHYTAMPYPFNYGFIPNTHAEDGDPVDVMIISSQPLAVGTAIKCRIVGMLQMEDEAGIDTKVIAVPTTKIDPFLSRIEDIDDVDESTKNKIKHFFDHYKELEPNKWVKTKEFKDRKSAIEDVKNCMK